ncbi:glycosyl hydrolase family 18 protein [Deinococcus hopiensis]|uniref:chitinase n=1 Tax=Deinococcus hopiensis KR-140 TaxID=695939 RepID=A0A1W1UQ38_9DEIO|nr:glycosyl hydrolase family 18 protein [Deinococcus hopiensis]SMB83176.1 chitinase [Deinococcus hopiensis KR-140]
MSRVFACITPFLLLTLAGCNQGSPAPTRVTYTAPLQTLASTSALEVKYTVSSDWKSGFSATVQLTNHGPAINGWSVIWQYAGDQVITSLWNGSVTQTGKTVTVRNAGYNASIPTGGTVSFGFNARYPSGTPNAAPGAFTVNGVPTGGPAPTDPSEPTPAPLPAGDGRWVMGYYVGYLRNQYPLDAVKWSALTHLVVGRVTPNSDGSLNTHFDIGAVSGPLWAKAAVSGAHANGKRALLMVGGAGTHTAFTLAASEANRARFAANLLNLVDTYGFDGIDLDWEPIQAIDAAPLKALAQTLKQQRSSLLLTLPVAWVNANFPADAKPYHADLAGLFDRINIMSYAMNGVWGGWQSWHSSALRGAAPTTPSSLEASVNAYRAAGVPPQKLGIGIGFFGSCYSGVTGPRQSSSSMKLIADDNALSYTNIVTQYGAMTRNWDAGAQVPYLSSAAPAGPKGCQFVSYEDAQSIALKADYVRTAGLGGAIIWNINEGYLPGAAEGARDPLMTAVQEAFSK